jgi:hypothetical protein
MTEQQPNAPQQEQPEPEPSPPRQCKEIPTLPVLQFLASMPENPNHPGTYRTATWYWDPESDYYPQDSVGHAMPRGTVPKLILAKMRMLRRAGLVAGCDCGCRGNFELTDKGRLRIRSLSLASVLQPTRSGRPE